MTDPSLDHAWNAPENQESATYEEMLKTMRDQRDEQIADNMKLYLRVKELETENMTLQRQLVHANQQRDDMASILRDGEQVDTACREWEFAIAEIPLTSSTTPLENRTVALNRMLNAFRDRHDYEWPPLTINGRYIIWRRAVNKAIS